MNYNEARNKKQASKLSKVKEARNADSYRFGRKGQTGIPPLGIAGSVQGRENSKRPALIIVSDARQEPGGYPLALLLDIKMITLLYLLWQEKG